MKKAFTLIEAVITIVILGILSAGTLVALSHLYLKSAKSKAISDLSSDSQVLVDQISSLLYQRVPSSVIGYKGDGTFDSIYRLNSDFNILEWIGTANESLKAGYYSGFVDLDSSDKTNSKITTYDINKTMLNDAMGKKFNLDISNNRLALIFAGTFDDGALSLANDFNNSFGWHNTSKNLIFRPAIIKKNTINIAHITGGPHDSNKVTIYEKYYLVDSAYTIARVKDVKSDANCIKNLKENVDNNTLLLFYNYRPWKKETFCADTMRGGGGLGKKGNVTILSKNVSAFKVGLINGNIKFDLTLEKKIRGSENNVSISKQKVVF